ncbi:MAG: site-2 protease family protein [Gemmatimonadales bacterium]
MQEFLLALPILLFSMVAHEFAHGYAAMTQGDDTAYKLGRLTLNPIKHIDPWMTILMPALLWFGSGGRFIFGGAKPVPVDPRNYHNYRRGDIIVSAAGIVTNMLLAILCVGLSIGVGLLGQSLGTETGVLVLLQRMLFWGIWLNLLLAVFNLIPIPPLDGSHLFYHLLPPKLGLKYRQVSRYGVLILLAIFMFFPHVLPVLLFPAILMAQLGFSLTEPFALQPFGL